MDYQIGQDNSNTTLVKVKLKLKNVFESNTKIQIQHLLKLNFLIFHKANQIRLFKYNTC